MLLETSIASAKSSASAGRGWWPSSDPEAVDERGRLLGARLVRVGRVRADRAAARAPRPTVTILNTEPGHVQAAASPGAAAGAVVGRSLSKVRVAVAGSATAEASKVGRRGQGEDLAGPRVEHHDRPAVDCRAPATAASLEREDERRPEVLAGRTARPRNFGSARAAGLRTPRRSAGRSRRSRGRSSRTGARRSR